MNPAYSVIFFTSSSGAGYGLVVLLVALERLGVLDSGMTVAGLALAVVLITAGLLASMFHLGHPERAWRALSQWRTSWLSREGVLAIACYFPLAAYGLALWVNANTAVLWMTGLSAAALSLVTVYSTSQIYASLKTVPRWNSSRVILVYLLMALVSGALLAQFMITLRGDIALETTVAIAMIIGAGWVVKARYWRYIDTAPASSTAESATGLGAFGRVSLFESPHTSRNFVMREMGYSIARKHALKLRRIALLSGAVLPILLVLAGAAAGGQAGWSVALAAAAAMAGLLGIVVERWLFFAEAEHVATLYYGKQQA